MLNLQTAEQMLAREKGDEEALMIRAESGHYQAQYYVGKRKLDSQEYEEARKWLRKSADQRFALAIKELAEMHDRGLGVNQSGVEAAKLYIQAAELGYVPAQIKLAGKYLSGDGVEKNPEHALFWLKVAAVIGSSKAAEQFKVESDKVPSPIVASAMAKADEYLKLHPEFIAQKDGTYQEIRVFPVPPPASK